MVSLAFNAVTNMEPRPGMENTLSTIELPAIINPKLCASMVINGGNAKRLTIFAIFHSDTPRALAYNTKSLLYPSKREERNTRMVPAENKIFQTVCPHNAENREIHGKSK